MAIKFALPPAHVWDRATTLLGATETAIFTYAPDIYVPSGEMPDSFLLSHEAVHIKQQDGNPDAWWERYFVDVEWRVEQELAAYREQYRTFKILRTDRNERARYAVGLAGFMAGPLYGKVIDFSKAFKIISG